MASRSVPDPGPLIASGRDADIFSCGPGTVLRRSREGRSLHHEAKVMQLVQGAGYPVPEVRGISDDGRDLLLERITGPTLLDDLAAHPWRLRASADLLAGLLGQLAEINVSPADPGTSDRPDAIQVAATGAGTSLVHLDLHPLNVLVSPKGPVVIDWTTAGAGVPTADVAVTWLVMSTANVPGNAMVRAITTAFRDRFVRRFLSQFDLGRVRAELPAAARWKLADENVEDNERARMRELVRKWER